ncbi:MAG: ribulose-phosphate 3-epimerase [Syntrophales bacterium]|nr:ribulose-phosphate 3-epimerase [Syntrophales bacterium]MCK9528698.1 ribulose-phosphate 3-epimerase [Syntrophales bacterium]MDX9922651.1 ribulose-phosphate 3-epimerase [Syntrophales bacterium]
MTKIAPSILSADFARLGEEIAALESAGADFIHVDVMDGRFVPNLTIGPPIIRSLRKVTELPLDVHLMIEDPDRSLEDYISAGCDFITVHVEAAVHLHRTVESIRKGGCRPGVSLNPATSLSSVDHIIDDLDLLLLMTVNPGFGGQTFIETMLPKIAEARRLIDNRNPRVLLEVDGGVTADNIAAIAGAGADVLVTGSAVFNSGDYGVAIRLMRRNLGVIA